MAHYYVPPEVQELADHVGDSFALARLAATLPCRTLVFAGVRFMAESAKLLSPDKTVLMPDPAADCPMAHMVRHETVVAARERYGDDLAVACYVNSTAEAKSWSDVCVTSSNAVRIVRALPQKNILFIPDRHLGSYVARQAGEKNVILNDGCCPIHQAISADEVRALKERFPEAPVLAHPECGPEVMALADVAGSTSQIIEAAVAGTARDYIVLTVGRRARRAGAPLRRDRQALPLPGHAAGPARTWTASSPPSGLSRACARAPARWACRPPRWPTAPARPRSRACSSWGPADVPASANWGTVPQLTENSDGVIDCDVVIVGCGVAGLYCALNLPAALSVALLSKEEADHCDSMLAQGGICVLHDPDDYESFFEGHAGAPATTRTAWRAWTS